MKSTIITISIALLLAAPQVFAKPKAASSKEKDIELALIAAAKNSKTGDMTMRDCPVVGNTESGIFHLPGQPHYQRMLIRNKKSDNRRCFDSAEEAMAAEVTACPTTNLAGLPAVVKCKPEEKVPRGYVKARTIQKKEETNFFEM